MVQTIPTMNMGQVDNGDPADLLQNAAYRLGLRIECSEPLHSARDEA